jgi:hypothetical protein
LHGDFGELAAASSIRHGRSVERTPVSTSGSLRADLI